MGGKSGGGGGGAGPMLEYGNKALDLQKTIYEEGKTRSEPYYQAGTQGLNELMMRLGLGSGTATGQTSDQIRASLSPSYTTTTKTLNEKPLYTDAWGRITNLPMVNNMQSTPLSLNDGRETTSIDNAGLDAAVQARMAEQQAATQAAQSNPLYGSLLQNFGMDQYQADPGYQFRLQEGNKALERALNARGKTYSPEAVKALTEYNSGQASQEYGNAYNRFTNDQGNIYNRLAGIAGIGQTATQSLAQQGQNYGNAAGELYTGMGNAVTAANQARAANKGSMFNTLLGGAAQLGGAYLSGGSSLFASDERLKHNITPMGTENGHNIYRFSYKGEPGEYIGVMAQSVLKTHPHAVKLMNGYLAVDYDAIGVKMRKLS